VGDCSFVRPAVDHDLRSCADQSHATQDQRERCKGHCYWNKGAGTLDHRAERIYRLLHVSSYRWGDALPERRADHVNSCANATGAVFNAVQQEYAVVFPQYYFGQIFEAQHQPGTVAYSLSTQLTLLQETVKEMARNGCKKVVIVNGHGGNDSLLPLFAQAQLASPRDYVVYVFGLPNLNAPGRPAMKTKTDMHAGETETSNMLVARPDLVHMDRATQESGADQKRQSLPDNVYTGIWWYARFPNHYSGEGAAANSALGEFDQKEWSRQIAEAIKAIKADQVSLKLQNQFFEESQHPLDTKQ